MGVYYNNNGELELIAGGTLYADNPIGSIIPYGGATAPSGWLLCQGQAVSRTDYSELFAAIGTAFGSGDSSTTFNLPDLREATTKGVGLSGKSNNHYDVDGIALGEFVEDRIQSHLHSAYTGNRNGWIQFINPLESGSAVRTQEFEYNNAFSVGEVANARNGNTTEVKAVGVNYIIKAKQVAAPADFIDAVNDIIKETTRECSGFLINSYSDKITGFGRATVTLKNGVAEIKFSAKIERSDTTDDYYWGLNADLLRNLIPDLPDITPISTNSQLQYFAANGTVLIELMGYSALAIPSGQFWTPARMYGTSGSVGSWGSSQFSVNSYITGTVYGTYEV